MCLYLRISLRDRMSTMCSLWFMFEELHLVSSVSIPFVCCGGMGMGMGKYMYGYGYGCGVSGEYCVPMEFCVHCVFSVCYACFSEVSSQCVCVKLVVW